ncbi:MAG: hypothetical protein MUP74_01260 [Desulfobacterales bacterium]|nr:hypothetical protein [Desulfobacterales bacterium]
MTAKRYQLKTTCPQCGCSAISHLTPEEIRQRYGDVPNVEMECSECLAHFEAEMKKACPEWDQACRMQNP